MAGSGIVAIAVLAELMVFSSRWVTWSDLAKYPLFPDIPEAAALQEHVKKDGRIFTSIKSMEGHMAETPFLPNTLTAYGVATIGGFDSIAKDGMVSPALIKGDARSLGRLGVTHLVTSPGNVPQDGNVFAVHNVVSSMNLSNVRSPACTSVAPTPCTDANVGPSFSADAEPPPPDKWRLRPRTVRAS